MILKKFTLLLLTFVLFSSQLKAQLSNANSPLLANGYIGFSTFKPNFKPKGFEASGDWKGAAANFGGMTFSFYQGQLRDRNADSTMANPNGAIFRIGYQLGKEYSTGNNSFLSAGIKPYFQISGSYAQIPNRLLNTQIASAGLVFSPGIQLRFSHLYLPSYAIRIKS